MHTNRCKVSIIIPTYRDWQRLSMCLHALDNQSFPKDSFEVIVVNNDPKDVPPDTLFVPSNCLLLVEEKPGSYSARNTALKIARGDILGFTDSDCLPDKDWVKNAVEFFKAHPEYTRIAGHIELFYKSSVLTLAELYEKAYAFRQDTAAKIGVSVTGNMFTYRRVFDKIGDFNSTLLSGGDYEWSKRAESAGFKIVYGKYVSVQHPARSEMDELTKKYKRLGGFFGSSLPMSLWRFCKYSIPPLRSLVYTKGLHPKEKIQVLVVRYYLNWIRSVEEVKIALGKGANRN